MEKEFVPYEQALALKELGFEERCLNYYSTPNHPSLQLAILLGNNPSEPLMSSQMYKIGVWKIKAPLYQQAFRWFREKYEIYSSINSFHCVNSIKPFGLQIDYFVKGIWQYYESDDELNFNTYEEAELECLKKLIEIVKNK
jgi:hypothetical protein